ncbi:MAG: Uma2 family endonuclease [Cyanobacteria bacterium J06627_8]
MTLANTRLSSQSIPASVSLKRWTVDEYHRISSLGILMPDERTELLAGHITLMAAKGTTHVLVTRLLSQALDKLLADQPAFVSTQEPIHIDELSEPEPDIFIVQGTVRDYEKHHPHPEEVLLIIEVSDSTLKQDCEIKDKLYAQAGVADYWVVDVNNRQLHIFREPASGGYASHLILKEPHEVSPLAFPDVVLSLTSFLPSAS